jgi:hypothetical protein
MQDKKILEGEQFNQWTLIEKADPVYWLNKYKERVPFARYWAQCTCGTRKIIILRDVLAGKSRSCRTCQTRRAANARWARLRAQKNSSH